MDDFHLDPGIFLISTVSVKGSIQWVHAENGATYQYYADDTIGHEPLGHMLSFGSGLNFLPLVCMHVNFCTLT